MSDRLDDLYDTYDRDDQDTKRAIGEYLYNRPKLWIPKTEIEEALETEIEGVSEVDDSVVSRHLNDLYDDEFLLSKKEDGQRYVQWIGRGSGGLGYWWRRVVPPQLRTAIGELRPLLTLETLGGAYVPTLMLIFLVVFGFTTALFAVVTALLPVDAIFGITVLEAVGMTGAATVMASVFLVLTIGALLLEKGLRRLWARIENRVLDSDDGSSG